MALERGWSMNLGGGFHHCSADRGGAGFCAYADITLAVRVVRKQCPDTVSKVMIIDLDASQVRSMRHSSFSSCTVVNEHLYVCMCGLVVQWLGHRICS